MLCHEVGTITLVLSKVIKGKNSIFFFLNQKTADQSDVTLTFPYSFSGFLRDETKVIELPPCPCTLYTVFLEANTIIPYPYPNMLDASA